MISEAVIIPTKSVVTPAFRKMLKGMTPQVQAMAAEKYKRWIANPQSLNFEPKVRNIYVVEVLRKIHAIAILEPNDVIKWIWIGKYEDYIRMLRSFDHLRGH